MKRFGTFPLAGLVLVAIASAQGGGLGGFQGGQGGGFGGGGLAGAQQGQAGDTGDGSAAEIEAKLRRYLDGEEVKNILTPGEYSEWKLNLKEGQVVIAEARSDAFDPALQVVDKNGKVLKENDDRYPGDQRPLLLWRCEKEGPYAVRARCFRDKSGGQVFLRLKVFDSVDAVTGKPGEKEIDGRDRFLVRVPMKAGQLTKVYSEVPNNRDFSYVQLDQAISPIGLPDLELAGPISPVLLNPMYAPVEGDYYILAWAQSGRKSKVRLVAQEFPIKPLAGSVKTSTQEASVWSAEVKKGDILEFAAPDLTLGAVLVTTELPDISKFDLKSDEKNPFFPISAEERKKVQELGPAISFLPSRARDSRTVVFVARRDAKLWLATNGASDQKKDYLLSLMPAAKSYAASSENSGALRVGKTDYWEFTAAAGDVMTFHTTASGFSQQVVVRDPDLREIWTYTAMPDQAGTDWNLIFQKPGKCLVAVSAYGDGGGGAYALSRNVFQAREFVKGSPATGNFSTGEAEVWKFTAKPGDPILVHWNSQAWNYSISIVDEKGVQANIPRTQVDSQNQYGVLTVNEPKTYLIVLIARGVKQPYTIELLDLPGYVKK